MDITPVDGGITAPKGYKSAAAAAGIKYADRSDMAMVYSERPAAAAGVFTTNVVKAAPVLWDRDIVNRYGTAQAIVVNSGIANACTGKEGMDCCEQSARKTAQLLDIPGHSVLLGSTGVIGIPLNMKALLKGIDLLVPALSSSLKAGEAAAKAIMTTDTRMKQSAVTFTAGGKNVTLGGMAKGSGMIHPNMCTMLAYLTTDLDIDQALLQKALSLTVTDTFNMISVDGDTSTNDTLLILANGMAENPRITAMDEDYESFLSALRFVCTDLARKMAADGEGAKALIEVEVKNADSKENARILARSVISSNLTKAAVFGHDANWGRVLCALGYAGVDFNPDKVRLSLGEGEDEILLFDRGRGTDYSEEKATLLLSRPSVHFTADMDMGDQSATAWGCDLTYDYVSINADYRS